MRLAPFDQKAWTGAMAEIARQQDATGPAERGMCFGLCILWLRLMQDPTARTPTERMNQLRSTLHLAVMLQAKYEAAALKEAVTSAKDAALAAGLNKAGGLMGLGFTDMPKLDLTRVGKIGMLVRMQHDLQDRDSRVLWGLVGPAGGHAIAGVNNSGRRQTTMDHQTVHVFDPNNGEFVAQMHELPMVVQDMFKSDPMYDRFTTMKRRSVSFLGDAGKPEPPADNFAFTSEKQRR